MNDAKDRHDQKTTQVVGLEIEPNAGWRQIPVAPESARARADSSLRPAVPDRRIDTRLEAAIAARFTTIDPVRDGVTGELFYDTSDEEVVLNVSRRGLCLRCVRPPAVGTRLLLELNLPGESRRPDMIGRVCWTRVEYEPGKHGARAIALVGVELLGGSRGALDTYDRSIGRLMQKTTPTVATREAVG